MNGHWGFRSHRWMRREQKRECSSRRVFPPHRNNNFSLHCHPLPYGTFKKNDRNLIHQSQVKCHKVWFKDSAWKRRGCREGSWVNNEDPKPIAAGTSWDYTGNSFTASNNPEGNWSVYVISKTPLLYLLGDLGKPEIKLHMGREVAGS